MAGYAPDIGENALRLHVHFHANQISFIRKLCTKTRFETEAQGNSEMAC